MLFTPKKRPHRAVGIALAGLLAVQLFAMGTMSAGAQDTKTQQAAITGWGVNAPSGLDAIGTYLVSAVVPAPVAGQAPENKWQHGLLVTFRDTNGPFGILSLDTDGAEQFASVSLNDGAGNQSVERFPYEWVAGRGYFLAAIMLPGNALAGFIYDMETTEFTFVGAVRADAAWGKISGSSATFIRWYGESQPDCASYARSDTYLTSPFNWAPGDPEARQSIGGTNTVIPGDCPATVTNEPDPSSLWRHYVAGSVAAPTTTTSTSTSTPETTTSTTPETTTTTTTTVPPTTTTTGLLPLLGQ